MIRDLYYGQQLSYDLVRNLQMIRDLRTIIVIKFGEDFTDDQGLTDNNFLTAGNDLANNQELTDNNCLTVGNDFTNDQGLTDNNCLTVW